MNTNQKVALTCTFVLAFAAILCCALLVYPWHHNLKLSGESGVSFSTLSVHCTVTFEKNGEKIFEQYHAGAFTQLGLNITLAKLTGNETGYNMTQYDLNATFISIGNEYGTWVCNTSQTVLPLEWNRTSALLHDMTYNSFNLTAVFHPNTGPYTADCISVNFEDGIGNNAQICYDTFSEVTGIDNTFTITVEFKISAS